MTNACCLDGHAAGHVHDGKRREGEKSGDLAETGDKQTAEWMDSWWCSTLFTFLFVLFLGVCLSLLPFICWGGEKTGSPPPTKKKRLFENKMQWRKLNSITHCVPQLKMNGVKLTPGACLHFPCRHATDQSRNHSEEERQRWQDGWKCQHVPYTHISLNVHQKTPQQHPCCELWVHISLTIFCLLHHHHDHPPAPRGGPNGSGDNASVGKAKMCEYTFTYVPVYGLWWACGFHHW